MRYDNDFVNRSSGKTGYYWETTMIWFTSSGKTGYYWETAMILFNRSSGKAGYYWDTTMILLIEARVKQAINEWCGQNVPLKVSNY